MTDQINNSYSAFVPRLLEIAKSAGDIIMKYYREGAKTEIKEDSSPVTEADIAANKFIVEELAKLDSSIPIVAEESNNEKEDAQNLKHFWLVDPLDGTKSFISKTGEFTVNIGLIDGGQPVLGVVYVPVKDEIYYTGEDGKAYMQKGAEPAQNIECRAPAGEEGLTVVASFSHRNQETDDFIEKLNVKEFVAAASSLKFCMVAAGRADIYPRFAPTMEWDTAAAHAVLLAAGGAVSEIDGTPYKYGKPGFKNTYFIAKGK